jgi:hypothetical protein
MRKRSRIILWVIVAVFLCGSLTFFFFKYDASFFHVFHNNDASCANCRSFMRFHFSRYAEKHDGWYPRGGQTPLDSLAKGIDQESDVHHYASHARQAELLKYWREHKTLSKDLVCYRYNEGFREDDPSDLIIVYYFEPTLWECSDEKMKELGRPVMRIFGSWEFLPEAEFQKEQTKTLDYLKTHGRLKEAR